MKLLWKPIIVAGVGGFLCGRLFVLAKKNPNITLPLLGYTAAFTTVGVATGVGVAFYRKAPLHVYGISVGANFGVTSFTYFGFRHILKENMLTSSSSSTGANKRKKLERWEGYLVSGTSGTIAGSLASLVSRQSVAVVAGTGVGGLVVGLFGQLLYRMVDKWRIRRAVKHHYPELQPPRNEWTFEKFEKWFLGFWRKTNAATAVESHLRVVKRDIEMEKKRIAMLDEKLEKGYQEHQEASSPSSSSDSSKIEDVT